MTTPMSERKNIEILDTWVDGDKIVVRFIDHSQTVVTPANPSRMVLTDILERHGAYTPELFDELAALEAMNERTEMSDIKGGEGMTAQAWLNTSPKEQGNG